MKSKKPEARPEAARTARVAGWDERIAEAQSITHVTVGEKSYPRLAYGPDHPDINVKPTCRDCGVAIGQLHVSSCCVERCAICGAQAYWCPCLDEADTTRSH
jgi:hypothetical protein